MTAAAPATGAGSSKAASPGATTQAAPPLRLRAGVRVAERGGATLVGLGEITPRWLRLEGTGIRRLLTLLDGRFTEEALLGAVSPGQRRAVAALLEQLRDHRLLEDPALESPAFEADFDEADLEAFGDAADARLERARIRLVTAEELTAPFPRILARAFSRLGMKPRLEVLSDQPAEDSGSADDLVVAFAVGHAGAEQLEAFNSRAVTRRQPWLPVLLEGGSLRLGPLVQPGEGTCYACFRRRQAANREPVAAADAVAVHPRSRSRTPTATVRLAAAEAAATAARLLSAEGDIASAAEGAAGLVRELRTRIAGSQGGVETEDHLVLGLPHCPVCSGPPPAAPDSRPVTPRPIPGPEVFDPLCGLVKSCHERPVEEDDPRVHFLATEATDSVRLGTGVPEAARFGCGVDVDRGAAMGAAMGEILERYSAAHYDPAGLRQASFRGLERDPAVAEATPPESFALFTPGQYEHFDRLRTAGPRPPRPRPFSRDTVIGWTAGESLRDGRPVWVPAPFVYLPYRYKPGEPYLGDCLSTGIACGFTREEAILKALYEVVERDATSITWHARLTPPRLDLDPGSELGRLYHRHLETPGTELRLLDLTLDLGLPTVAAFLLHEGGGTVVGSATRADRGEAARKALLEAVQGQLVWKEWLQGGPRRRFADDFHDVTDFPDHPRAYMAPSMRRRLDFLWQGPHGSVLEDPPATSPEPRGALRRAVDALTAAGLEAVAVDVTSPDVAQLGYWVMRVVVPGLQPLNARHDSPYFGGHRLSLVPFQLGHRESPLTEAELNPDPHPFP